MAIVYVGGQTVGRAGSTSTSAVTFSLTGGTDSTPQAGDLVVITSVKGSAGRDTAQAITTPTGYTHLGQLYANSTYDTSLEVSYKFMGETPDTSFTRPSTGSTADAQRHTVQVFRDVDPSTPLDVTVVSATGTATGRPNPGSITPTTTGAAILICAGGSAATGASYTAPSGFATGFLTGNTADTNDAMIGSGYQLGWTSGAVDPAAYTGGTTNAADSWAAYTIALRPAPTAVAPTVTTSPTNQSTTVGNTATFTAEIDGDPTPDLQWESKTGPAPPAEVTVLGVESLVAGTNNLTVPSGAKVMLFAVSYWDDTSDFTSASCSFATLTYAQTNPVNSDPYPSGTVRGNGPVTATGSQTLTISFSAGQLEGPSGFVVYLDDVDPDDFLVERDTNAPGFDTNPSVTLDTVTGGLLVALEGNTGSTAIPGNVSGWTSHGTATNNNNACRIRSKAVASTPTETVAGNGDTGLYKSITGWSIKPITGGGEPTWENVTGGSGATTGSYTTPTATIDMDGWEYRLTGTNSAGSVTTTAATLTVTSGGTSHAATGALANPGGVVAGSASSATTRAATGVLSGAGATIAGSAARSSGSVTHDSSGTLSNPGATATGSAARTRQHPATGVLANPGGAIAGTASSATTRAATGVLANPGATVAGAADRTRSHPGAGVLANPGASVSGAAARTRQHSSTGVLSNPGATVAGSAAREREHFASGVLANPGGQVSGSADRTTPSPVKDSTGAISGAGGSVAGTAARARAFASSGVLSGAGAQVAGSAARTGAAVSHDATGALSGPGAQVTGAAIRGIARRVAGTRKNYIIQGRRLQLTDWELQLLLQQLMPKRSDVQIVEKKDVRQISRKLWKRLRETNAALESLTLDRVDNIVQQSTIDYDEDDDLVMLLL